uniref:Uncharacterized protein n=1 Tax=Glossina brevipalpis TaxID=37001 RepID=A0A1A9W127_9MUSC
MDVMDDLVKLFDKAEAYPKRMEKQTEQWLKNLHKILYGDSGTETDLENKEDLPSPSPQQTIKRVKRLSSLEEEEADDREGRNAETKSNKKSNEALLSSAHGIEQEKQNDKIVPVPTPRGRTPIVKPVEPPKTGNSDDKELMPPPLPRSVLENVELFVETIVNTSGRPKRAAKSKSEKNFKEPSLNTKLRQPNVVSVKVKLEEEQRQSQMKISTANASTKVDESVIVLPSKKPSTVKIDSDSEEENLPPTNGETEEINNVHTQQRSGSLEQSQGNARSLRIRIKREKISLINKEEVENDTNVPPSVPLPIMTKTKSEKSSLQETCMSQNVSNTSTTKTNATVAGVKKGRKKKNAVPHKPIKVERFSVLENPSPVASRTRRGGSNQTPSNDDPEPYSKPQTTIYEDAIEIPPLSKEGVAKTVSSGVNDANANETFNVDRQAGNQGNTTFIVPTLANDATFKITSAGDAFEIDSNLNSTLTLQTAAPAEAVGNATFDVPTQNGNKKGEDIVDQRSFETAKDASLTRDSSLITEDDSPEQPVAQQLPQSKLTKTNNIFKSVPTSSKSYKLLPGRSYELFK